MQNTLFSLNTSTGKVKQSSKLISKQNNFLAKQKQFKYKVQENISNFEKKTKVQTLLNLSNQAKTKLAKRKLKQHFDDNTNLNQWFQRDLSLNSSNFRRSKLKNQTKDEMRSNKLLLSILLSQISAQPKKETKMLKQIQNQFCSQSMNNSYQKMNCIFADILKVKKCNNAQQSQVVTPKTTQPKDCIFRKKHMVHHSHQLTHLLENPKKNLSKRELSMVSIKKYPFSRIKLVDKSEQLRKIQSQNVSRVVSNYEIKRQKPKLQRVKQKQHKNSFQGISMQPWRTKDEKLYIQIDQFI